MIGASIHVLVSMRTKTEWVIEENERGKKTVLLANSDEIDELGVAAQHSIAVRASINGVLD
jgi:hypothetical protein